MRILTVIVAGFFLILIGCSSDPNGTNGTAAQTYTGTGNIPGYTNTGDGYQYDPASAQQSGYADDLPTGVFPAVFGWDGRDYNVFLGLLIDPSNSYSLCNPQTFANSAQQASLRNQFTFGNPYSATGAYNPQAQYAPTLWNYDTTSGGGSYLGIVRKGGQYDPDYLCR